MNLTLVALLLVVPLATLAEAPPAFQQLSTATEFEEVQVGIDGHLSAGVKAYRVNDESPQARELFVRLGDEGTLVAQLYAAIGLRNRDPKAFEVVAARLRRQAGVRVKVKAGCLSDYPTVGELLESRSAQAVRLAKGQSLREWLDLHQKGVVDIIGGGYSASFGRP